MRFARPCLQCNKLHQDKGDYCLSCRAEKERQREADPYRRAKKKALYNNDYRLRRKQLIDLTVNYNIPCHICNQPFKAIGEITADHLDPGNPQSALAPAHLSCNSSRGNAPLR